MFKYHTLIIPVESEWVKLLIAEYQHYLEAYHKEQKAVRKHLIAASKIFIDIDVRFIPSYEIDYDWVETKICVHNAVRARRSLIAFLCGKKLIKRPDEEIKYRRLFESRMQELPNSFSKGIIFYYEEKFQLRKRQVEQNASKVLSVKTIDTDVIMLRKMVKWLVENYLDMTSWLDVTEESVNGFFLILKPSNRECVRKDLYQFFVLLKRKRLLFTIPMTNYKARNLAMTTYVMNFKEQSRLAKKLLSEGIIMPYEAIVTSLIFYHAVQTRMISTIKLSDIDADNQQITMKETPDIYLMPIEMKILKEYLLIREGFPNSAGRKWLFIQRKRGGTYGDEPIERAFVFKLVRSFSGYNTKILRMTCLSAMANYNGPQFLCEAYGISHTQAGRYGKYEEYLLEEALNEMLAE